MSLAPKNASRLPLPPSSLPLLLLRRPSTVHATAPAMARPSERIPASRYCIGRLYSEIRASSIVFSLTERLLRVTVPIEQAEGLFCALLAVAEARLQLLQRRLALGLGDVVERGRDRSSLGQQAQQV